MTYPSGHVVAYTRDFDSRVTAVTIDLGAGPQIVGSGASYRPNGPLASMTYGDGFTYQATHDTSYRLTGMTDSLGATSLRDLGLTYTMRNNLASVFDSIDPLRNENFRYSARELLTDGDGPWGHARLWL